jgi:diguanylate cyclase (GGDEF)-like protein/PAS domain S-box-containing protein
MEIDRSSASTQKAVEHEQRLEYDKLTFFYISLPYMLLGQILGAFLLAGILIGAVDNYSLGIWIGLSILVTAYRWYHYYLFRQADEDEKLHNSSLWIDRYYTDVLVGGILWGSSAFLLFPDKGFINLAIVLLFLVAIGFSSMGVLASKRELLLTYVLVVFIPMILRLFFMEEIIYQTIAYAGLGLVLLMILAADFYGEIINNSLQTRRDYLSARHSYQQLRKRFFSLFEHAPVGIFHFDRDLLIEEANQHFLDLVGLRSKRDAVGKELEAVISNEQIHQLHHRVLLGFPEETYEPITLQNESRSDVYVKLSSVPMHDDQQQVIGGISILRDVTPEIEAKKALEHATYYDALTDLPNRTLLLEKLKKTVDQKLRTRLFGALLVLDVDHFNNINRSYGQNTGDKILRQIAQQLTQLTGDRGMVARLGADTYTILLPELTETEAESKEAVLTFAKQVRKHFEKVLVVGEVNYHINFSIGAVLFDSNDRTPLELLKNAESAMFVAKGGARGSVRFYTKERDKSILYDLAIANDIYRAIRNNELEVYYQPQQDIHSGILVGAEALVRWNHPRKGLISPAHFIPIAEESGAIIEVEEWIFEQAFKDMRTMAETLTEFPLNYIALNVSSIHFLQPNFVDKFMKLIHQYRIDPLWVNLELTESGVMRNIDEAIERIHELKRLGFSFSIDDFGTGYSSLTYLKNLPVDIIKIDRAFVKDADRNEGDRLIVEAVIDISRKFGFKVLAEGIDRQETLDYFKTTSCKTFQGYLYYKPISMREFIQLI